jgi:hypothetical protein
MINDLRRAIMKQEQVQKTKSATKAKTGARRVNRLALDQTSPSGRIKHAN